MGGHVDEVAVEDDYHMDDTPRPRLIDVQRFRVAPDGSRTLEGAGEFTFATGSLTHLSDPPFSVALGGADGAVCSWVRGSTELAVAPGPGVAPTLIFNVPGATDQAMQALAETLGAAVVLRDDDDGVPEVVRFAAGAIETAGGFTATVLSSGAGLFSSGIGAGLQYFKANVSKTEPVTVGPLSTSVIDATSSVTAAAADLTGSARDGMRSVASTVGSATAEGLTGEGRSARFGSTTLGKSAACLGAATLGAAATVYGAVEESTAEVVASSTGAASEAVGHRYGADAEGAARKVGTSVRQAHKSVFNVASLGIKSLGKAAARETAREVGRTVAGVPSGDDRATAGSAGDAARFSEEPVSR